MDGVESRIRPSTGSGGPEALEGDVRARHRVVVERIWPETDGGRFPIKRTSGEQVTVSADVFADGHDVLAGVVKYRHLPGPKGPRLHGEEKTLEGRVLSDPPWQETPLTPRDNDRWDATFTVTELGEYEYTIEAWVDRFGSWLKGLVAKADAGQDVSSELLEGAELIQHAALQGSLRSFAEMLRSDTPQVARVWAAKGPELRALMDARPDRSASTIYEPVLTCVVDSVRARFGAWYEMFPRSVTPDASRSGTFREAEARLADIADMGFDVVYLPPVHPIGRNTSQRAQQRADGIAPAIPAVPGPSAPRPAATPPSNPGSARSTISTASCGSRTGWDSKSRSTSPCRHRRIIPGFASIRNGSATGPTARSSTRRTRRRNTRTSIHSISESDEWEALWYALRDVFLFWIGHGVRIFRVDNPHTKPFPFWEWVIAEIRRDYPDAIFLAEAFTRPKVMRYLAKSGFNQSYTYFTWRNTAHELREYLTELTKTELQEYMRPNLFANTPDILHEYLQTGGRPAFEVRLILAATLSRQLRHLQRLRAV